MSHNPMYQTSIGVAAIVATLLGVTSTTVAQEANSLEIKALSESSTAQDEKNNGVETVDPQTIATEVQPIISGVQPDRVAAEFSDRSSTPIATPESIAPPVITQAPESIAPPVITQAPESIAPLIAQQPSEDALRQQLQERLQQLEQRQQQLEEEIQLLRQELQNNVATPPSEPAPVATTPEPEDGQGISVSAEALFLTPTSSNLQDFAIVGADRTSAFVVSGDVVGVDYDSTTALRLSATYDFPNSPVDVSVRYSTFNTEGFNSVTRPRGGVLLATLANPSQNESATFASAEAGLNYRATNVELGYTLNPSDRTNIRLFGGLAFADIDQELDVRYNGDDFNNAQVNISRDFTGYGLRVGGQANFGLGSGFSLFGRAATSLLFGSFRAEQQETDENGQDLIVSLDRTLDNRVIPAIELAAGLEWEQKISNQASLNFAAGYEFQNWFNVVDSARLTDNSGQGVLSQDTNDLSLSGFFIRGGLHLEF